MSGANGDNLQCFAGLSALWACYAVRRQIKLHGWSWWRVSIVAVVNFAACPLCMVIATVRGE